MSEQWRIGRIADDIATLSVTSPELFETKRRATGLWTRWAFWNIGALTGTALDKAVTGTAMSPLPVMLGMLAVTTFIYFDPPGVRTFHVLKKPIGRDAA